MTKFIKENFEISGQWIHYNGKFIARVRSGSKVSYVNFIVKNFEVEEYFNLYNSGMAPLTILETKGFISPNMRKALKSYGCPTTKEGIEKMKELMRKDWDNL